MAADRDRELGALETTVRGMEQKLDDFMLEVRVSMKSVVDLTARVADQDARIRVLEIFGRIGGWVLSSAGGVLVIAFIYHCIRGG